MTLKRDTDVTGQVFSRLEVVGKGEPYYPPRGGNPIPRWICECVCGNIVEVGIYQLLSKHTESCGCLPKEILVKNKTIHGMKHSRIYNTHQNMLGRCNRETNTAYKDYGERGIKVCDRWMEEAPQGFLNFLEDMGDTYEDSLELDRIDNNLGYFKENCRWANRTEQCYNQRKRKDNKTGRTGVSWKAPINKYQVSISKGGKSIYLGVYSSFEEACKVREDAERKLYGAVKGDGNETGSI